MKKNMSKIGGSKWGGMGIAIAMSLFVAIPVLAEESAGTVPPNPSTNVGANSEARQKLEMKQRELMDQLEAKKKELNAQMEAKRAELKTNVQEKRGEIKDVVEQKREEMQNARGEFRQERADNRIQKVSERFTATVERLEKIATRIDSRIAKISASSTVDLTPAKAALAEARTQLDLAKTQIAAFSVMTISATSTGATTTPPNKGANEAVKKAAKVIEETLRSAHKGLMNAVNLLVRKNEERRDDRNGTSTRPANVSPEAR